MKMAAVPNDHALPIQHQLRNSSLHQPSSMFNSFKNRLSRKDSAPPSSASANMKYSNPQNITPATRRPAPGAVNPYSTPGDAPPAYSPAPNAAPSPSGQTNMVTNDGADDPYAFLSSFDTVFLVDDSGSMAGSRWQETRQALEAITPICTAHDADGIDIIFLNRRDSEHFHNVVSTSTVREIFSTVSPGGGTPTGQRLNQILKPYLQRYERSPDTTKPINIICITDGEPSDDVESPIIAAAKKLDKLDAPAWQVGIQFFQVGRDEAAKLHLKQLDDELAEIAGNDELRDIVDTVPFLGAQGTHLSGDGILKVVLGAVNRRLDRKKNKVGCIDGWKG